MKMYIEITTQAQLMEYTDGQASALEQVALDRSHRIYYELAGINEEVNRIRYTTRLSGRDKYIPYKKLPTVEEALIDISTALYEDKQHEHDEVSLWVLWASDFTQIVNYYEERFEK